MIRVVIAALALALAGTASAETVELDVDEDGCYQVPPKCIEVTAGETSKGPGFTWFNARVLGSCEGRVLVRLCVEGRPLALVGADTNRMLFGTKPPLQADEYLCVTTWRTLPDTEYRMHEDRWRAGLTVHDFSDHPTVSTRATSRPTGRYFAAWIGSLKPENDAKCVAKHETWTADPPPFRN